MRVSRLGLQAKIILLTGATVALVVAASTVIALWLTRDPIEAELYGKALAQAEYTAHQLVSDGQLKSPQALLESLRQAQRSSPGVVQAAVYAAGGPKPLLTATNAKNHPAELDALPDIKQQNGYWKPNRGQMSIETPNGRFWIISTDIRSRGAKLGSLVLMVSKSPLNAVTGQLVLQDLLLLLGSLAVVILVIHLFFLREIRSPVKEMVRVMERAQRGELDRRARISSEDEVGQLAGHLNRMLERLQNFNIELERKVEDATATLARRNDQLKRINEELFETQKTLARSERLAVAGQLAAALAHEIGTPLNSISGHVQLLARQSAQTPSVSRRLLVIERQIDNIVRTVKQLLSWTRKFDLKLEPVDLRRLIEDSLLLSSPGLQHRRIDVQTHWPPEAPWIYGDAGYFQQVFLNLINNSMDAMPRGGTLRVTLSEPGAADRREVSIAFEDTGTGIAEENLRRIFEPMFTTKRLGTGAGLGLAICDQIIRQHGGSIRAESELGRGTRFTIVLPADCRAEAAVASMEPSVAAGSPGGA